MATGNGYDETASRELRWWRADLKPEDRYKKLNAVLNRIRQNQVYHKNRNLRYLRMYGNAYISGMGLTTYVRPTNLSWAKAGLNVAKSCSDALTAKLTKDEPKVTFLTSGGDWSLQQRAKQLEKFVEGQFYELKIYELAPQVVLDACIFGTGFFKLYAHGEGLETRIKVDRVFPWEIVVDDQEAIYGAPRNMYQRKWVDRQVLKEQFGTTAELAAKIAAAKRDQDDVDNIGYDNTADQVLVTEGWHLPSGPNAIDGRHTIAIENATLFDEPWTRHEFPFVIYRRQLPPIGFWGTGICEELEGLQFELNTLMTKVQRSFHLLGAGHWLVENGSDINTGKIDNDIGSIIRYTGVEPKFVSPEPLATQIFEHMDRIYNRCFEITGISKLEAQSMKPAGLNSGKAIDSYLDITAERFSVPERLYHRMFPELAEHVLQLSREIVQENPEFDVMMPDKNDAHHVKFKANELEEDEYVLKLYPTNKLSDEPSEKMAQVQAMASAGWIAPQDAKRLLDFPDLERAADLDNASYNAVESCISKILKDGEYIPPQPFLDLTTAVKQVQMALIKAFVDNAPQSRQRMLREWIADAQAIPGWPGYVPPAVASPSGPVPGQLPGGAAPPGAPQLPGGVPPGPEAGAGPGGAPIGPMPPPGPMQPPGMSNLPGAPVPASMFQPTPVIPVTHRYSGK